MKPLISIIVPTYQNCDKLKIAIDSVLAQTYQNFELLIIDDGSNDGTKAMVKQFKDSRIFYKWQFNSGGPANPRNQGIKISKGEWIAFLDSDDSWKSNKLQICTKFFNDEVDLLYHDLEIVSDEKIFFKKKTKSRKLKTPVLIDLLINGNAISNSSVIIKKKILKKIGLIDEKKSLVAAEDYHTWLKVAKFTDNFFYIPSSLGYYCVHKKNISNKNMSMPTKYAVSDFISLVDLEQKKKIKKNLYYIAGKYYYLNANYNMAKKKFLFVLKNGEIFLRIQVFLMIIMMRLKSFI